MTQQEESALYKKREDACTVYKNIKAAVLEELGTQDDLICKYDNEFIVELAIPWAICSRNNDELDASLMVWKLWCKIHLPKSYAKLYPEPIAPKETAARIEICSDEGLE